MRRHLRMSLVLLGAIVLLSAVSVPAAPSKPYTGVTVNVLTFTGPQIAEPLQRRGPAFGKLTGARINVVTVPFSDLYQKVLTDMATGTNSFQAFVFAPQWMVDYITPGYLEDITSRVRSDQRLRWNDIAPFFRDFSASFAGRIYTIPLDGDFQMVYYRSDQLQRAGLRPPQTWDDYLRVAQALHKKDLNGDGRADFGSCIAKKRNAQSYWMVWSVAGAFLQSQGTSQGSFFDLDTFKPLTNNDAFAEALRIYVETGKYGPPDELNWDVGDSRSAFVTGRCGLSIDWGDIGTLAIDPKTSKVANKVGAVVLPGTRRVLNRATGRLVACTSTTCPYATGGVNHAPFAAFGGWSGAINKAAPARVKEAAYAFLSYMSQPAQANTDVTIGITGFNPYRRSQFQNTSLWLKAGMSAAAARNYLGAIEASLGSPNMVLDLRIPQNQRYQQVVLDTAIAKLLARQITIQQAMKEITDGWEAITNEFGRDTQAQAYRATLGVKR